MTGLRPCAALLVLAACGGDGFTYEGTAGQPVEADFGSWVPRVQASLNGGEERTFIADTGAPLTIIDSVTFPDHGQGKANDDIEAFGLTFPDYETAAWPALDGVQGGLIGGDLLRHFAFTLDYQNDRVWLADPYDPEAQPADLAIGPVTDVPFKMLGGGLSGIPCGGCGNIELHATRILVKATLEDQTSAVWALVDTGASAVVIDESMYDFLPNLTTRPRLDGIDVNIVGGVADAFASRLWRVRVQGPETSAANPGASEQVDDVAFLVIPGSTLLAGLSAEVGLDVRMVIGGTVMREFLTTIDYQADTLRFARYTARDHISPYEWVGVGFGIDQVGSQYVVSDVYDGTDAEAEGLIAGDVIEELAGTRIGGQTSEFVSGLFSGYGLGDEIQVGIRGPGGTIENHLVLIEDLLPSYPPPP